MTVNNAGVTTLRLFNATGERRFVATASVVTTPAGQSVTITLTETLLTVTGPVPPDSLKLHMVPLSGGSQSIRTFTWTSAHPQNVIDDINTPFSEVYTFFFTSDGQSGSPSRSGMLEMVIEAVNTTGIAGTNYSVHSDGSNAANTAAASVPSGGSITIDRAWVTGSTTATITASRISSGGTHTPLYAYPDTIFGRAVLAVPHFEAFNGVTLRLTGPTAGPIDIVSSTTDDDTHDSSHVGNVDEDFSAGVTASSLTVIYPTGSLPNTNFASGGGATNSPRVTATKTDATFDVDPRLTAVHLFQIDDDTFGTPPLSKNVASKEMLTSQTGFLATRILNARSEGQNGLTVSQLLDPVLPGTNVGPTSTVTALQGGQDGWTSFLVWESSKPGGTWNKTSDVTAPSSIDGNSYLLASTDAYTMLAVNPNYRVIVGGGVASGGDAGDHWHPGETFQIGATLVDMGRMDLLAASLVSGKEPKCVIGRFTDTGLVETLRADAYTGIAVTAATWVTLPDDSDLLTVGNLITLFNAETALGSGADSRVWLVQIHSSVTAAWDTTDLVVIARFYDTSGTPYSNINTTDVLSRVANGHSAYRPDPLPLLGLPGFK